MPNCPHTPEEHQAELQALYERKIPRSQQLIDEAAAEIAIGSMILSGEIPLKVRPRMTAEDYQGNSLDGPASGDGGNLA
jgi:hypothetical protein